MTDDRKTLADELAAIASRCSHELDRQTIIKAASAIRSPVAGEIADRARSLDHLFNLFNHAYPVDTYRHLC